MYMYMPKFFSSRITNNIKIKTTEESQINVLFKTFSFTHEQNNRQTIDDKNIQLIGTV